MANGTPPSHLLSCCEWWAVRRQPGKHPWVETCLCLVSCFCLGEPTSLPLFLHPISSTGPLSSPLCLLCFCLSPMLHERVWSRSPKTWATWLSMSHSTSHDLRFSMKWILSPAGLSLPPSGTWKFNWDNRCGSPLQIIKLYISGKDS